jgi:hypothetical protein
MNQANLIAAFELLNDFLSAGNAVPVWLVVGGGSALLVQQFGSRQTKDVDVMALREWEGNIVSAYPLPDAVKQAAAKVAEELRLDPGWLNCAASLHGFDFALLPSWFWQEIQTREYGQNLKISFIGRKGLILLKLSAALDRDVRRDIEDLVCLSATCAELEELLRWLFQNIHETRSHPKLPVLLQELGHADLISRFS